MSKKTETSYHAICSKPESVLLELQKHLKSHNVFKINENSLPSDKGVILKQ